MVGSSNGTQMSSRSRRAPESGNSHVRQTSQSRRHTYESTAQPSRRYPPQPSHRGNGINARTNAPKVVQQYFLTVNQYYGDPSHSGSSLRERTAAEIIGMPPNLCDENGLRQERRMPSHGFGSAHYQEAYPQPIIREFRPDWADQDPESGAAGGTRYDDHHEPEVWEPDSDDGESHDSHGPIITPLPPSRAVSKAPSTGPSVVSRGRQPRRTRNGH